MPPLDLRSDRGDNRPDRHIPIRVPDLLRLLDEDAGSDPAQRALWSRVARILAATFHHDYLRTLNELKDRYAPLNPDNDCVSLPGADPTPDSGADEAFLSAFERLMERANYRALDMEVLRDAITAPNELGLNYVPDFELFEHLRVWVRGATSVTRFGRSMATKYRRRMVIHDGFKRMVLALKFRPGFEKRLGDLVRTDVLYLRLFKDVPHVDLEMHLPEQGTRVKMRMIDKASIASPVAVGLPTIAMKLMAASLFTMPTTAVGAILAAPISAGLKSFFGFQQAKQRHLHHMIRQLYYLTLANNEGVISRLVDSAEEEEFKEALLAYHVLRRGADGPDAGPWTDDRLDRAVEELVLQRAEIRIDFEIRDALRKLLDLGLVHRDAGGALRAIPPEEALTRLDRRWDSYFP